MPASRRRRPRPAAADGDDPAPGPAPTRSRSEDRHEPASARRQPPRDPRDGPARRPGGPGRRCGSAGRARPGAGSSRDGRSRSGCATGVVEVRVVVVARPGHDLPAIAAEVRTAVGGAIERLLGPASLARSPSSSTASAADGARAIGPTARPGGDRVRARRAARRLALAALFEAEFGQRTAPAVLERHLAETEGDPETAALRPPPGGRRRRATATRSMPGSRPRRPQYPVVDAGPDGPRSAPCGIGEVLHSPRRRPGWRSPSGSSWRGSTEGTRPGAWSTGSSGAIARDVRRPVRGPRPEPEPQYPDAQQ